MKAHNCTDCAAKDVEIQRLAVAIADLREELATALHLDGILIVLERQLNLLNKLRQSTWIGSDDDMAD